MQEIARHSAPGATIATFSAAAAVRDALSQAGFTPEKIPGYGAKRDMLTATLTTPPAPRPHWNNQPAAADGPIAIIGAGIAGSTTARALAESGRRVTLYHSNAHPAASHVPLAVPYLNPDSEDSPDRPYQLATWHHAMRALHTYPRDIYNPCGVTNHAENPREIRRQQALLNAQLLSADEISGDATDLTYPRGGVIHLPALLAALADHPNIHCENTTITNLAALDDYAAIIHCCGWQQTLNPATALRDTIRDDDSVYSGAGFDPEDTDLTPRDSDDAKNLAAILQHLPGAQTRLRGHFVGIRGASRDHMPLVGAIGDTASVLREYAALRRDAHKTIMRDIAHHPRQYIHQGLGSKGCTYAWLNADILTAIINATPIPLPAPQLERINPTRYLIRALKHGQI